MHSLFFPPSLEPLTNLHTIMGNSSSQVTRFDFHGLGNSASESLQKIVRQIGKPQESYGHRKKAKKDLAEQILTQS